MRNDGYLNKMDSSTYLNKDVLKNQLENRLKECQGFTIDASLELEGDTIDYANSNTRFAQNRALHSKAMQEAEEITRALQNLYLDSYGVCEDCGRPIPMQRLVIVPSTTLCVQCKHDRERGE